MDLVLLRSTPFRLFNLGLHLSLNRFCVNGSKLIWAVSGGGQGINSLFHPFTFSGCCMLCVFKSQQLTRQSKGLKKVGYRSCLTILANHF
jgi:hypothetical protein